MQRSQFIRLSCDAAHLSYHKRFWDSSANRSFQSRLGIHLDSEAVMISTPLDKYEVDVYELAEGLSRQTGLSYSKKRTE